MPKLPWPKMMDAHPAGHLIVAITTDIKPLPSAKILVRLFAGMGLRGDYALNPKPKEKPAPIVECVFALARDADALAKAFNAKPVGKYPGWASQREFIFDKWTEGAILAVLAKT